MTYPVPPGNFSSEEFDKWLNQHSQDERSTDPVVRLAQACFKNQVSEVERLVSQYEIDVNLCCGLAPEVNRNGDVPSTALQHACRHGYLRLVKTLVKVGANVNAPNTKDNAIPLLHYPPIEVAYDNNQLEVINFLIESGAEVNSLKNNEPLPSRIVRYLIYGDPHFFLNALQLLVNNGGDIDHSNEKGLTPLAEAFEMEARPELIRFLVFNGARTNSIKLKETVTKMRRQGQLTALVKVRDQALKELSSVKPMLNQFEFLTPLGKDVGTIIHDFLLDVDLLTKDQKIALPKLCCKIGKEKRKKRKAISASSVISKL